MDEQGAGDCAAGLATFGAGAALAAGWAAQRRVVSRSVATEEEIARAELVMPPDVEHHDVEVDDGGRIHVVSRGKGQPIVLLHGVFLNSGIWVHQLADLSDELPRRSRWICAGTAGRFSDRTDSVARRLGLSAGHEGFGPLARSEPRRSPCACPRREAPPAFERLAQDVRQVLADCDVEGGVLVGHSMGGMVAIQAVAGLRHEERHRRLSGLVLTSTTTGPFVEIPGWDLFAALERPCCSSRVVGASVRSGRGAIPKGDVRWWASRLGFGAEAPPAQVRFVEAMLAERRPGDDGGTARASGAGEPDLVGCRRSTSRLL